MRAQDRIIGNSAVLAAALERLSHLATINRPVLLLGERGTGKELAAQRLHFLSPRWDAPLIKVNCAAMAESLLESELFGHEPGAFTGATKTHKGRFERADGGTLFLDELGTMSLRLQEKLLRLVEYGEFERVGGQETISVDVRVVAATNADLHALIAENRFRADLLDRLSFDVVHLPALRQRVEDITELAQHFAIGMCAELGWDLFAGFTENAMAQLQQFPWPGNIRELKNAVERSLFRWDDPHSPVDSIVVDPFVSPYPDTNTTAVAGPQRYENAADTDSSSAEQIDFHAQVAQYEKQLLRTALQEDGYNQRRTAQRVGLSYDQIRGLVRKHKLSRTKKASAP